MSISFRKIQLIVAGAALVLVGALAAGFAAGVRCC